MSIDRKIMNLGGSVGRVLGFFAFFLLISGAVALGGDLQQRVECVPPEGVSTVAHRDSGRELPQDVFAVVDHLRLVVLNGKRSGREDELHTLPCPFPVEPVADGVDWNGISGECAAGAAGSVAFREALGGSILVRAGPVC